MVLNTPVRMAATRDPIVTPTATHNASFNEVSASGGKILNSATTVNLPTYECGSVVHVVDVVLSEV